MILYNCKPSFDDGRYIITKWSADLDIESSYITSISECECPAGVRPTCRHRQMLPHFIATDHIGDDFFFCFDDQTWHQPFESVDHEAEEARVDAGATEFNPDGADTSVASVPSAPAGEVERSVVPSPAPFKRRV